MKKTILWIIGTHAPMGIPEKKMKEKVELVKHHMGKGKEKEMLF